MASRHTGQKPNPRALKKSSRTAANPAMEGAHTPSAESITIPRKIKPSKNKRGKDRTSTPQKRN